MPEAATDLFQPRRFPPPLLAAATPARLAALRWVLVDLDDTLTTEGRLPAAAYAALEALTDRGLRVVVVTGRPAGWCDMIARQWPVAAAVGENGALWYAHDPAARRMRRHHALDEPARRAAQARLAALADQALAAVPGCALAADQPFRLCDLAVDLWEDVGPLDAGAAERVAAVFRAGGAAARASSIQVNAWFGNWDKLAGVRHLFAALWEPLDGVPDRVAYVGDGPNDEPMFAAVPCSVGVANVAPYLGAMRAAPAYVTRAAGGAGFVEFARAVLTASCAGSRVRAA